MSRTSRPGKVPAGCLHILVLFVLACTSSHAAQSGQARQQTELEAQEARLNAELDELDAEEARLNAERDELDAEEAKLKAEMKRLQAEDAQYRATADQLLLWVNPDGRSNEQIHKQQNDWIMLAAKKATVPRSAGPLIIRRDDGNAIDVKSWRGGVVMLVAVLAQAPALDVYLDLVEQEGGIRKALVLIDKSRGPRHVASRLQRSAATIGQADGRELRTFLQQDRVYSGTFVLIDAQGTVRYQGPFREDMLNFLPRNPPASDSSASAARAGAGAKTVRPSPDRLAAACQKSYHDSAIAGGHLDTWNEGENLQWCKCLASNLTNVLTAEEQSSYLRDPVAFVRVATADPPANGQRDWRLFVPITNCWR